MSKMTHFIWRINHFWWFSYRIINLMCQNELILGCFCLINLVCHQWHTNSIHIVLTWHTFCQVYLFLKNFKNTMKFVGSIILINLIVVAYSVICISKNLFKTIHCKIWNKNGICNPWNAIHCKIQIYVFYRFIEFLTV